jgi:drug/metabolite transporter (DMT)-like permease
LLLGWRWSAVIVGFRGVLIALRPSTATLLSPPSLIAFAGSIMFAFLMITTRTLRGTPDIVLVTWQTAAALVFGLPRLRRFNGSSRASNT